MTTTAVVPAPRRYDGWVHLPGEVAQEVAMHLAPRYLYRLLLTGKTTCKKYTPSEAYWLHVYLRTVMTYAPPHKQVHVPVSDWDMWYRYAMDTYVSRIRAWYEQEEREQVESTGGDSTNLCFTFTTEHIASSLTTRYVKTVTRGWDRLPYVDKTKYLVQDGPNIVPEQRKRIRAGDPIPPGEFVTKGRKIRRAAQGFMQAVEATPNLCREERYRIIHAAQQMIASSMVVKVSDGGKRRTYHTDVGKLLVDLGGPLRAQGYDD